MISIQRPNISGNLINLSFETYIQSCVQLCTTVLYHIVQLHIKIVGLLKEIPLHFLLIDHKFDEMIIAQQN